jgi:hypothetical protein
VLHHCKIASPRANSATPTQILTVVIQIATLGHELQHAVEIAEAPEVVDARSLARFYARVGSERTSGACRLFDTQAAVDIGWQVSRELRKTSSTATQHNLHRRHRAVRETSRRDGIN